MNSRLSCDLWSHARKRAADLVALAAQEDVLDGFAGRYLPVESVADSAVQVLALTIDTLAAMSGQAADEIALDEVRQVLVEQDTPRTLSAFWWQSLNPGHVVDVVWDERVSRAIDVASRPAWDDTLSINGPGVAPHPAYHGPPAALAIVAHLAECT